jgi:hypothetical protein
MVLAATRLLRIVQSMDHPGGRVSQKLWSLGTACRLQISMVLIALSSSEDRAFLTFSIT